MRERITSAGILTGLVLLCSLCPIATAEQFVQRLISVERNLNVDTWQITSGEITPDCAAHWALHKYALHGGKQEGVDVIVLNNGKLRFTVIPTRGMSILSVTSGDLRLGWDSPVKEVVNPRNINLQSRGGLGWLEGFNEWMVRCGLEYAGHPGTDKFINNVGAESTMDLTLHGRIGNTPASEVEVVVEKQAPWRIHIRGRVDERMFYGPKLTIQTDLSTEPGTSSFRVEDVITNQGPSDEEFEIIYHTNYGRPLLEEGSSFIGAERRIAPFNPHAAEGLKDYATYSPPTPGFIEQVYCMEPAADADGNTMVMLQNAKKDRALSIAWSVRELPLFTLWKNTTSERDGYVTGLEPGTNYAYNRRIEREGGRVKKLAPGASRHIALDFSVLSAKQEVRAAAQKIRDLQGETKPQIVPTPVATE